MQAFGLLCLVVSLFCLALLIGWQAPPAASWHALFRRQETRGGTRRGFDLATALHVLPWTRHLTPRQFRTVQLLAGVFAGCLYGLPSWLGGKATIVPPLLAALAGACLPHVLLVHSLRRRRLALDRGLMDLVSHLGLLLAAGCHPLEAFERAPQVVREPLHTELRLLIPDLRLSTFPAALERFAARTDSQAVAAFVRHVLAQQQLGIQLEDVLDLQEQVYLRRQEERADRRIEAATGMLALGAGFLLANAVAIAAVPFWYYITGAFAS